MPDGSGEGAVRGMDLKAVSDGFVLEKQFLFYTEEDMSNFQDGKDEIAFVLLQLTPWILSQNIQLYIFISVHGSRGKKGNGRTLSLMNLRRKRE